MRAIASAGDVAGRKNGRLLIAGTRSHYRTQPRTLQRLAALVADTDRHARGPSSRSPSEEREEIADQPQGSIDNVSRLGLARCITGTNERPTQTAELRKPAFHGAATAGPRSAPGARASPELPMRWSRRNWRASAEHQTLRITGLSLARRGVDARPPGEQQRSSTALNAQRFEGSLRRSPLPRGWEQQSGEGASRWRPPPG